MAKENYSQEAWSDARNMLSEFIDQIAEQARDGDVSTDLYNDFAGGDEYHHETHRQHSYRLSEAAAVLEQLWDDLEDDEGLWEGLAPRKAIESQAVYTYSNAVYSRWRQLIEELNDDYLNLEDASADCREGYARLFVLLTCAWELPQGLTGHKEASNFARMALAGVSAGDLTDCLVFCDWLATRDEMLATTASLRAALVLAQTVEEEEAVEE